MSFLDRPGELASTPLAAVLLEALNLRVDGQLAVAHGGGTSRLWFRAGRPVGAQVVTGFRPVGLILLQAGLIDVDALSRSLAQLAATGRPQGELLVEMGAVSREAVDAALADQQAGYVAQLAALDAGAFAFDRSQPVPEWTRGARLSALRTIVDALERPQAAALAEAAIAPSAAEGVRLASGYAEVEAAFGWSAAERALVEGLAAPSPVAAALAPRPGIAPARARAILAGLLLLGLALPAGESPAPSGETSAGLTLEAVAVAAPRAADPPAADSPPAASPAVPLRRSDPAEARSRRQRLLARAMQNMGIGPLAGAPGGGAAGPRPDAAAAPGAPDPSAPGGGEAERALREALREAAPRARSPDLFTRLGLPDGAGREEVKRAFLQIARQLHPDRFAAPALADLADEVRRFFTAVNEAYAVLSDERRRTEYLQALRGGAADPEAAAAARIDFQKGEACLRTRDLARARGFLEAAVRADPRAEYQAALAWCHLVDPAARDPERARALLAEAVRDAGCDRAHHVAGILARDEGDEAGAERSFRAALAANPRHAEAARELRLLEGRRDRRRG